MYVNSTATTASDAAQPSQRTKSNVAGSSSDFESQLSSALTESLQKLGVGSGEINISVRNASASTRQIVVTYSLDEASLPTTEPGASPATASPNPTTTPQPSASTPASATNPFLLSGAYVPPVEKPATDATSWAPYTGPRDTRDEMPQGGGKVTASGAPLIVDNTKAAANQYGYTGPAAKNPYFSTPSNPLREGYVLGFNNWFQTPMILGGPTGPQAANKTQFSTEEGAQEALRIVQQFSPGATVVQSVWQSGPYSIDTPMYEIDLGEGRKLNAGGVLSSYYTHGYGVLANADETIRRAIQLA